MNFSLALKEELIGAAPHRACCQKAYLRGLFLNAAQTKSGAVVLRLSALAPRREASRLYRGIYKKEALMDGTTLFCSSSRLLADLLSPPAFTCKDCALQYLRGAMITAGSVTDPEKSYHLELRVKEEEGVCLLRSLLAENGWQAKERTLREGGFGLYFKSSDIIEEILTSLGANNALFALMNAKITHDIRNEENRATNCVARNISKSVGASGRALEAIAVIRLAARFEQLSSELRETAALREENPDASLFDLAKLHNPPLTKSGLNHRLQKIITFADTLKPTEQPKP